jgi:predicted aspartyl protease
MRHAPEHIDILIQGPVVEARIFPDERSFLKHKVQPKSIRPFRQVRLLVDTGANFSSLHLDIIEALQLPHYLEKVFVKGAGGQASVSRYRAVLQLTAFGRKGLPIDILEGEFSGAPYDGVIGRDVLRYCKLTYDGLGNSFRLTAPGF